MRGKIVLFISMLGVCCELNEPEQCYQNNYATLKRYDLDFTEKTPGGIYVDPTGQDVDLGKIDRLTGELEVCLGIDIRRECFGVKIPDDWTVSPCTGEQLLNIPAPDELCRAKGLELTPECPCRWRVETQDRNIIVATPNLKLYKAELARIVTGKNNVWIAPEISKCLGGY